MKKLIALVAFAFATTALAASAPSKPAQSSSGTPYKSAGCGVGHYVFKDEGITQIFAATTNGTFGNQTFGISTGTLDCAGPGGYVYNDVQQQMYVESNFDSISQEMAQGSGEHLSALATLMGCQSNAAQFSNVLKDSASAEKPEQLLQSARAAAVSLNCES